MALNKAKAMESALKSLNQGKVGQAIQEYQTILRSDPNDQVVLMTVGDLFVRQSNMSQAVEYFERLAQLYLNDGFNSKAIAIYKKISKLAPSETQPLEKLANLYVQQGVLSEARPIFLQLAEAHLKANQTAKAVEVLRRLLEVEPDNPRVQRRLAELYMAMGQKKEAAQTYLHFARYLQEHGDSGEALKMIDAAISAQPGDSEALTLKARMLGSTGNADAALDALSKLPNADSSSETIGLQIDLCLKSGKSDRAVELVQDADLKGPEKYALVSRVVSSLMDADKQDEAIRLISGIRESAISSGNQEHLAKILVSATEKLNDRIEPHEWLVDLYRRTADNNLSDAQSQLAEALINAGDAQRAEVTLNEILEREPDNELARQRLSQVQKKLGRASTAPAELDASAFEPPAREPLAGAPAERQSPANEAGLDDETQQFITQALTDVDLFSSYGLSQKAIQLLETILQRVPQHAPTLERLLDLSVGSGNDRRTAELAAQLERIYTQRGDAKNAERFTELRSRFQRASGATEEELAAPPVRSEPSPPAPTAAAPPDFSTSGTQPQPPAGAVPAPEAEIDLSDEWESLSSQPEPRPQPEPPPPVQPSPEPEAEMPEFDLELVAEPGQGNNEPENSESLLDRLVAEVEGLEAASPEAPIAAAVPVPQPTAYRKHPTAPTEEIPAIRRPSAAAEPALQAPDNLHELSEVFQEFRAELGEMEAQEQNEDLETHYNLGIAYREMGLLDEAIGEFQKVAKAVQDGQPFRYAMQCCTFLGLTFTDKMEPKIAALWYERALALPGLEQETVIALRYDLAMAEEQAGNVDAALESFRQVYAMNIDYRDVSERISALQKH
ncbi:MAG TPA: tetratricopeptide repeat protein [Candidatus Acidoferrales bacterium]|nr:tetratricopeptide repeat protein [Candidatus Acidoferrales bacterium]